MARRRKTGFVTLIMLFCTVAAVAGGLYLVLNQGRNIWLDGYSMSVVKIDLLEGNLELTPALPEAKQESFEDMVNRLQPVAAINGTFFDSSHRVLGDVVIEGKLLRRGGQRHAIAMTDRGEIRFLHRGNKPFDWTGIKAGLASGPLLVRNGKIDLDPVADGFKPASRTITAWRSAVGVTEHGELLFVSVQQSITVAELARIMLELDARDAINLDGGSATGLYHDGKILVLPTVEMTNILIVRRKSTGLL